MKFMIVAYYTHDTIYEKDAIEFIKSIEEYDIPFYLEGIDDLGGWYANTGYKPTFIRRMMDKFSDHNIVYIDVDARFFAYPKFFEEIDHTLGVHLFDRSWWNGKTGRDIKGEEILSGTVFLQNNDEGKKIVQKWIDECKRKPNTWDQKSLEKIMGDMEYCNIPASYCVIFDIMRTVKDPVIIHYQRSRDVRKNGMRIKEDE